MSRTDERSSHISIGLRFLAGDGQWEHIEALGWHEGGFNFYHAHEIHAATLDLKRSLTRFSGSVMWSSVNTSDDVALGALVNEMIYQRAQAVVHDTALRDRLIKLIRVSGMVVQKQKVLASLGQELSDAKLADMLTQKRQKQPLFHYGVQVDSDAWRSIVKNVTDLSSVVISLEKWSEAVGPR